MAQKRDTSADGSRSLGLPEHRGRKGVSLERIAASTKINMRYLKAIAAEEFETLPGGIFSVSHIRQYAAAVEFDERPILARLRRCGGNAVAGLDVMAQDRRPHIVSRSVLDWIRDRRHRCPSRCNRRCGDSARWSLPRTPSNCRGVRRTSGLRAHRDWH